MNVLLLALTLAASSHAQLKRCGPLLPKTFEPLVQQELAKVRAELPKQIGTGRPFRGLPDSPSAAAADYRPFLRIERKAQANMVSVTPRAEVAFQFVFVNQELCRLDRKVRTTAVLDALTAPAPGTAGLANPTAAGAPMLDAVLEERQAMAIRAEALRRAYVLEVGKLDGQGEPAGEKLTAGGDYRLEDFKPVK